MGRAIDRLPVDFAEPRTQPRAPSRSTDLHHDGADLTTSVPHRTQAEAAARTAAALRTLASFGAGDLAEMLGLTEPPKVAGSSPTAVPCPQCQAPAGARCVSLRGKGLGSCHRGRCRRAEAGRAGRSNEELTEESA